MNGYRGRFAFFPKREILESLVEETHCIRDIDISRRNLRPLLPGLLDLLHIPNTKRRATQLTPYLPPAFILRRSMPIRQPFDTADEGTGVIDLVRVCDGETDDGTNFRVQGRWLAWLGGGSSVDGCPRVGLLKVGLKSFIACGDSA